MSDFPIYYSKSLDSRYILGSHPCSFCHHPVLLNGLVSINHYGSEEHHTYHHEVFLHCEKCMQALVKHTPIHEKFVVVVMDEDFEHYPDAILIQIRKPIQSTYHGDINCITSTEDEKVINHCKHAGRDSLEGAKVGAVISAPVTSKLSLDQFDRELGLIMNSKPLVEESLLEHDDKLKIERKEDLI